MTPTVLEAINQQVSNEFSASFSYLSMAGWCEHNNFMGAAAWLRVSERRGACTCRTAVQLPPGAQPSGQAARHPGTRSDFSSLLEVFEQALAQEHSVSGQIDRLYELAFSEKVFAAMAELQWFITEQVEEEKTDPRDRRQASEW